jgi:hypothetical protein
MHEYAASPLDDKPGESVSARSLHLLSRLVNDLFGLHPFLSAGVLWPQVFRAIRKAKSGELLTAAAFFVFRYSVCRSGSNGPRIILAPAAVRAAGAVSQQGFRSLSQMDPVNRVDSDSLCIISSFLCGCDFLRVIRVCRRWSSLRLRPAAWPSPQPCDAHSDEHVAAFYDLFEQRGAMFNVACIAFRRTGGAGVRLLLERGVLGYCLIWKKIIRRLWCWTCCCTLAELAMVRMWACWFRAASLASCVS